MSKVTQKVVAARLIAHLQRNSLREPLQSAYRQYFGIETDLLKLQNDILHIINKRKGAALLLLDPSASIDTIYRRWHPASHTPAQGRHYRRFSEVDGVLCQRQDSSCSHIRKAVKKNSADMWGPPRLCTWSFPVFNIHYSSGSYHQKSRSVVVSVC